MVDVPNAWVLLLAMSYQNSTKDGELLLVQGEAESLAAAQPANPTRTPA